jgi:hypothetical protein
VLEAAGEGFAGAASGGAIRVKRVRPEKAKKIPAGEYVSEAGLKPGDRLV